MSSISKGSRARVPAYLRLKNQIRKDILDKRLVGRIPSERQLAKDFKISHMTARRAVCELVAEGLARRERGRRGTFVVDGAQQPRTMNIAIIMDHSRSAEFPAFPGPYYDEVVAGIQDALGKGGYILVVPHRFEDVLPMTSGATKRKVDGIILLSAFPPSVMDDVLAQVPVVLLNRSAPGIPSVLPDNYTGGVLATRYLIQQGHRRIAHITGTRTEPAGIDRERGYRDALAEAGLAIVPELVVEGDFTAKRAAAAAGELFGLPTPPTAIFCADDMAAQAAMREARNRKVAIPEEVSIVGFDDLTLCRESHPTMTTIHVPRRSLGRRAAESILAWLSAGEPPEETVTVLAVQLAVRESCREIPAH